MAEVMSSDYLKRKSSSQFDQSSESDQPTETINIDHPLLKNFSEPLNEINKILDEYDITVEDAKKAQLIRSALVRSHKYLASIDMDSVETLLENNFGEVGLSYMKKFALQPFRQFLDAEEQILTKCNLDSATIKRIMQMIQQIRLATAQKKTNAFKIARLTKKLELEIKKAKNKQLELDAERRKWDRYIRMCKRTLAVGVVVANSAGASGAFQNITSSFRGFSGVSQSLAALPGWVFTCSAAVGGKLLDDK